MKQRQNKILQYQKMSFSLPKDIHEFVKREAKNRGFSMSLFIAQVLREKQREIEQASES
ncbi:MAG: hypothetical protein ACE5PV_11415 [Candidatus Poribacteria bacterium]